MRFVMRTGRDLAIGFALIAAIPIVTIVVSGDELLRDRTGYRSRIVEMERLRALRTPVDATLSPEATGAAFNRVLPSDYATDNGSGVHGVGIEAGTNAGQAALPALFAEASHEQWMNPGTSKIVAAATGRLSAGERAWAAAVAAHPIWRDADLAARAGRADLVGTRFRAVLDGQVPLSGVPYQYPRAMSLANAGVARVAHHVAMGDYDRAESAARTILSLGFVLLDNSLGTVDAVIAQSFVNIGRDALRQIDVARGRHERDALTAPLAPLAAVRFTPASRATAAALQRQAIADLLDPAIPRAVRADRYGELLSSACGSPGSALFGAQGEVDAALAQARQSLARTDAERRLLALIADEAAEGPRVTSTGFVFEVVQGAARLTSVVTGHPRIEGCTRAALRRIEQR